MPSEAVLQLLRVAAACCPSLLPAVSPTVKCYHVLAVLKLLLRCMRLVAKADKQATLNGSVACFNNL